VTPAKKAYPQKFRKKWLTDPQLRDWLIEVPKRNGESGAECKVCKTYLNIKICDLKNHALTKKHIKNLENLGGPKHQLLLKVEANALTEVDGFHHSEGGIGTPPSGFVIQQSSITPRELPSNQSLPKTRCKKIDLPAGLSDTDDEGLYDDDIADPDFSPHDPPDSPEMMNNITTNRKSPDLMNELPANRKYVRPAFVHYSKGSDLSRFVPLFDRVLVQKEEAFSQILLKDGVLIAPKMNTARVVAVGTGIRSDSGEMIPLEVSVGDEVMIPEYGGTKVELDGKEYILYCDSDLLAKFRSK
ncbi:unnamed protein product, partial [Meganyctiphanes norvegica]